MLQMALSSFFFSPGGATIYVLSVGKLPENISCLLIGALSKSVQNMKFYKAKYHTLLFSHQSDDCTRKWMS